MNAVAIATEIIDMANELQRLKLERDALAARLGAAVVMTKNIKEMVGYQTGARYADRNIITAYADQAIAVIEGRAPVTHTKAPSMFPNKAKVPA